MWELKAKGVATRDTKHKVTAAVKALPTPTHMMIVKLQQVNASLLKLGHCNLFVFCIMSNVLCEQMELKKI